MNNKKDVYEKILKELKKGNTVLADVVDLNDDEGDRYRLIRGNVSLFDFIHDMGDTEGFVKSCFCSIITDTWTYRKPKNSEELIKFMKKFDTSCDLHIKNFIVLK